MLASQSSPLTRKFIDALYTEAMVVADEARAYFDDTGHAERDQLPPQPRVLFSCEALKVTARLMACVTWLLSARAGTDGGGMALNRVEASPPKHVARLPDSAQVLIAASQDLYDRVARLEAQLRAPAIASPARDLLTQLSAAF
jgi:regulator of CtrA degradation